MILDSSFLIDIEREHEGALAKARAIEEEEHPRRVPMIVLTELYIGVGKGVRSAENRRRVERVLRSLPVVTQTESISKRAGIIEGELQAADENEEGIGLADALIAATAREYDEPIVTADPGDFLRVEDVEVETY